MDQEKMRSVSKKMFIGGFFMLPWLWLVNVLLFFPKVRAATAHPDVKWYIRNSFFGFLFYSALILGWMIIYLKKRNDIDQTRIYVFGRSLGGAAAIALSSIHSKSLAGLILENTFTSISDLVNTLFPYLTLFKPFVLRLEWNSLFRIKFVECPILFLSGKNDEIVPHQHMLNLYETCEFTAKYRQILVIENGTHNDCFRVGGEIYVNEWKKFIAQAEMRRGQLQHDLLQQENRRGLGLNVRSKITHRIEDRESLR